LALGRDRTRDALDRQLAGEREAPAVTVELHAAAVEDDLGMALDVEEVARAQVRVALLVQRLQAGDADRARYGRLLAGGERALELTESPPYGLDHQVLDAELHRRMRGVDRPRTT